MCTLHWNRGSLYITAALADPTMAIFAVGAGRRQRPSLDQRGQRWGELGPAHNRWRFDRACQDHPRRSSTMKVSTAPLSLPTCLTRPLIFSSRPTGLILFNDERKLPCYRITSAIDRREVPIATNVISRSEGRWQGADLLPESPDMNML